MQFGVRPFQTPAALQHGVADQGRENFYTHYFQNRERQELTNGFLYVVVGAKPLSMSNQTFGSPWWNAGRNYCFPTFCLQWSQSLWG